MRPFLPLLIAATMAGLPALAAPAKKPAAPVTAPVAAADAVPSPAQRPPAPPVLGQKPAPAGPAAARPTGPPSFVPPGIEGLPGGLWRVRFASAAAEPPAEAMPSLVLIGSRLADRQDGRVTVLAQTSGPSTDASTARRLSLERGLAVKRALSAGGIADTRIDVRPLGTLPQGIDAVDIQGPPPRQAAAR